ncbi:MAG: F0F1 ATP synthase subunit A [Bacteroidetes bacterium]|nr:F0F1 ATP synthase subunit A [Bacteroidota bacterium]
MIFGSAILSSASMLAANVGKAVSDTAAAAVAHAGSASNGNWVIEHVSDSHTLDFLPFGEIHLPHFSPIHIAGLTIDMSLTKHVVMMWIAGLLVFLVLRAAAKGYKKSLIPRRFANAVEMVVLFIRDDVVLPATGEKGRKLLPYFLTLFFFILFSNLFELIPYASTPSGDINFTASLALIAFFVIQISGVIHHGFFGYFKGLIPKGVPIFALPILAVVEILGLFTKPFALCVRLFANLVAGDIAIFSFIGLIFVFGTVLIAPLAIGFALFIELLEVLVAFIQAYIFTILTALFVGMAIHQEH